MVYTSQSATQSNLEPRAASAKAARSLGSGGHGCGGHGMADASIAILQLSNWLNITE